MCSGFHDVFVEQMCNDDPKNDRRHEICGLELTVDGGKFHVLDYLNSLFLDVKLETRFEMAVPRRADFTVARVCVRAYFLTLARCRRERFLISYLLAA